MRSLHTPSGWKQVQKKRAELLPVCCRNLEKSKCRESIAPQTQNGPRWIAKKRAFSFEKNARPRMLSFSKKHGKMCLCSFFSVHLLVFFTFLIPKKSGKIRKMSKKSHFFKFFLMLCTTFYKLFTLYKKLTVL